MMRKSKSLSFVLILMMLMLTLPISALAADTSGESRLVRVDFSANFELSSTFSPDTYIYSGTVSNSVSSLTLTPYAMDGAVTIRVNGFEVINGSVSRPVELSVGSNIITVVVQSLRDSNSTKNYVFTINRQHEINNADLKSLFIDTAEIDQPFKAETTYYTGRVLPSQSYVVVKPTAHQYSQITINNTSIGSSGNLLVDLDNGINTITITVKAQGGATKTYTVVINRPKPSDNANLKSVVINGKTYTETGKTYVGYVPMNINSVDVQINTMDSLSTILLDGQKVNTGATVNLYLKPGASILFPIEVTASDGRSTKSYNLYIVRQNTDTGSTTGSNNGSGNSNSSGSSSLSVNSNGSLVVIDGKGAIATVDRSGNVRTYTVTLSNDLITKAIEGDKKVSTLVIDYSEMMTLNDKVKLNIDGSLSKLLQSKAIKVKLMGSIGSVTADLTKLTGWNSGGSLTLGKDSLGASFGRDYIPESNFVKFDHTGYSAGSNPFDIEIKVFSDADLKLANVYRYEDSKFDVVMSTTGDKSKKSSNVKSGHYIVMSFKKSFTDINNHWSKTLLDFMAKKQIVSGYPDDTFMPDRYVTRAEFTSMLVKAVGERMTVINNAEESFEDVNKNDWYYDVVNAGWRSGLITGVTPSTFNPDANITREQMAAISVRALKQIKGLSDITEGQAETILGSYRDATDVSPWAKIELATAINEKIIEGVGQNMLASQELATRAQAATVVYKVLNQIGGF